jgi:predicted CoA-binding protein
VQTLDDASLRELLGRIQTIAVIGIKAGESDDAFRVPRYMQREGYRILPVSPKLDTVLGAPVVRSLGQLSEPPDLVNLFRAPAHIPGHVDEILALPTKPLAVWMQLGIAHPASRERLERAGIRVIEDRCLMVDHARLFGRQPSH